MPSAVRSRLNAERIDVPRSDFTTGAVSERIRSASGSAVTRNLGGGADGRVAFEADGLERPEQPTKCRQLGQSWSFGDPRAQRCSLAAISRGATRQRMRESPWGTGRLLDGTLGAIAADRKVAYIARRSF